MRVQINGQTDRQNSCTPCICGAHSDLPQLKYNMFECLYKLITKMISNCKLIVFSPLFAGMIAYRNGIQTTINMDLHIILIINL